MSIGYRIKTWRRWETMEQKLPDEWDVVNPNRGSLEDEINEWLSKNHVEPLRVGYSCVPVGVVKASSHMTYLHTMVITYLPQEHVHDARTHQATEENVKAAPQEIPRGSTIEGSFAQPVAAFEPPVGEFADGPEPGAHRLDGPADINRVASLLGLPAERVHRAFADAAAAAAPAAGASVSGSSVRHGSAAAPNPGPGPGGRAGPPPRAG